MKKQPPDVSNLVHSIEEVCGITRLSRPTVRKEINSGDLRSFRVGRRLFVAHGALLKWIASKESQVQAA